MNKKLLATQFSKYVLVGALTLIINLIIVYFLTDLFRVYYVLSASLAFLVAMTLGFYINDKWTFKAKVDKNIGYMKYIFVNVFILFLDLAVLYALVEYASIWYMSSQSIAFISSGILGFFVHRRWTFKVKESF